MDLFIKVLDVVFPVFAIIGAGYLFAHFKKISLEPIIETLIYLTVPALVISSLSQKEIDLNDALFTTLCACGVVLGGAAISYIYLKSTGRAHMRGFYLTTMFMNSANIPLPLTLLAFGREGLTIAIIYYIVISILVYSVGIYIAKGEGGLLEIFKLPLLYSTVIGVGLNLGGVRLPEPLFTAFDMLGAATIPLMQVCLGYQLYSTRFSEMTLSVAASVIRIAGGFVVALFLVTLLDIQGITRNVILLSSAMPSAVMNFVMSYKYGLEKDLVASTVALTTLISILTIPIMLMFML